MICVPFGPSAASLASSTLCSTSSLPSTPLLPLLCGGTWVAISAWPPDFAVCGRDSAFVLGALSLPRELGFAWPFILAVGFLSTLPVRLGAAFSSAGLSCTLLALAAVGRIMRSRKLPSEAGLWDGRGSGPFAARDVRGVGFAEAGAGLVAGFLDPLMDVEAAGGWPASRFAADEAVGAVRCEGRLTGRVGDLGRVLAGGEDLLVGWPAGFAVVPVDFVFAADDAVDAVSELLLAFLVGSRGAAVSATCGDCFGESVFTDGALAERGVLGWLAGDLGTLELAFGDDLSVMAGGLPAAGVCFRGLFFALGKSVDAAAGVFGSVCSDVPPPVPLGLKSSVTGGSASPPETAASSTGSLGFMSPGSSSTADTGLSGFSAGLSSLDSLKSSSLALASSFLISTGGVKPGAGSIAFSGIASLISTLPLRSSCSFDTVFFNASTKSLSCTSKLPLR